MKSNPPKAMIALGCKPKRRLRLSRIVMRKSRRPMKPEALPGCPSKDCVNLLIGLGRNQEVRFSSASSAWRLPESERNGNLDQQLEQLEKAQVKDTDRAPPLKDSDHLHHRNRTSRSVSRSNQAV